MTKVFLFKIMHTHYCQSCWLTDGKKIIPKAKRDRLDEHIEKQENDDWWRTIRDEKNDEEFVLTDKVSSSL